MSCNTILSCWSSISSRVLQEGNVTAWNVMDQVMESNVTKKHNEQQQQQQEDEEEAKMKTTCNDTSFCNKLHEELNQAGLFEKLLPARTKGDVRTDDILSLLTMKQFLSTPSSSPPSSSAGGSSLSSSTTKTTKPWLVRGDKSIFLSREYRKRNDFSLKHPYLHKLISTVTNTLQKELSHCIKFDFTMTSVQLAIYPGDGKSGYIRHCDRGEHFCKSEQQPLSLSSSESSESSESNINKTTTTTTTTTGTTTPERIITAVYYLTDQDWNATLDGGYLRLFQNNNQSIDITPYRDRMIIFRSDCVEHQVLPSLRRQRIAITMWFYGTLIIDQSKTIVGATSTSTTTTTTNNAPETVSIANVSTTNNSDSDLVEGINSNNSTKTKNHDVIVEDCTTSSESKQEGPPPLPLYSSSKVPNTGTTTANTPTIEDNHPSMISSSKSSCTDHPTIFVSIASFRDSETVPTIKSLFMTAKYPTRIYVGLMIQLDDIEDLNIWNNIIQLSWFQNSPTNIRYLRMDAQYALGPCYARSLCQSLYRNETYVLTIDSHMRFRQNWDEYLIYQLDTISLSKKMKEEKQKNSSTSTTTTTTTTTATSTDSSKKVMLSAYPVGYHLPNNIPNEIRGTILVPWKFDSDCMLRQRGKIFKTMLSKTNKNINNNNKKKNNDDAEISSKTTTNVSNPIIPCPLYAAGFNFAYGCIIHDVPYDQSLHDLFFGEEISMALRLYTHGYDIFTPPESVCYHLWSRAHRPTNNVNNTSNNNNDEQRQRKQQQQKSMTIVKNQLLGKPCVIGTYCGLGTIRTVSQFSQSLGINFQTMKINNDAITGKKFGWYDGNNHNNNDDDNTCLNQIEFDDDISNMQESSFAPDSIEHKVAMLDTNARQLISSFLLGGR